MTSADPEEKFPSCPFKAVVLCDYSSQQETDISVRKGELLTVQSFVDDDWLLVRNSSGEEGYVSRHYVRPCAQNATDEESDPDVKSLKDPDGEFPDCPFEAVVLCGYSGKQESDLSVSAGDVVTVKGYMDNDWLLVRNSSNALGYVSRHYVKPRVQNGSGRESEPDVKYLKDPYGQLPNCPFEAVVLCDYSGKQGSILSVAAGDVVTVKGYMDNDWILVRTSDNVIGFVSRHFVRPSADNVPEKEPVFAKFMKDPEGVLPDCPFVAIATYFYPGKGTALSINKGDLVLVEGYEDDDWLLARDRNNVLGFVSRHYVVACADNIPDGITTGVLKDPKRQLPDCPFEAVVISDHSGKRSPVLSLGEGDIITVVGYQEDWLFVRDETNRIGYVLRSFVRPCGENTNK